MNPFSHGMSFEIRVTCQVSCRFFALDGCVCDIKFYPQALNFACYTVRSLNHKSKLTYLTSLIQLTVKLVKYLVGAFT